MISVVMPAYNEAALLGTTVREVVDGLRALDLDVRGAHRRERLDRRHADGRDADRRADARGRGALDAGRRTTARRSGPGCSRRAATSR